MLRKRRCLLAQREDGGREIRREGGREEGTVRGSEGVWDGRKEGRSKG